MLNGDASLDYVWLTDQVGTDTIKEGTGASFLTHQLTGLTSDTTLWVGEENSGGGGTEYAGPLTTPGCTQTENQPANHVVAFEVNQEITLDSVSVIIRSSNPGNSDVWIEIDENSSSYYNGAEYTGTTNTIAVTNTVDEYQLAVGVTLSPNADGTPKTYYMRLKTGDFGLRERYYSCTPDPYPYVSTGSSLQITGFYENTVFKTTRFGPWYNWVIQGTSEPCPAIPITATENCPCEAPNTVGTIAGTSECFPYTHEFEVTGFVGAGTPVQDKDGYLFEWYNNISSSPISSGIGMDTLSATTAGTYYVVVKDTSELSDPACLGTTADATLTLTPVLAGTISADKYYVCDGDAVTLTLAPGYILSLIHI